MRRKGLCGAVRVGGCCDGGGSGWGCAGPLLFLLPRSAYHTPSSSSPHQRCTPSRLLPDIATQVARETRLDCVTLDGDQVRKTGAMAGGYLDKTASRLLAMKAIRRGAVGLCA